VEDKNDCLLTDWFSAFKNDSLNDVIDSLTEW